MSDKASLLWCQAQSDNEAPIQLSAAWQVALGIGAEKVFFLSQRQGLANGVKGGDSWKGSQFSSSAVSKRPVGMEEGTIS